MRSLFHSQKLPNNIWRFRFGFVILRVFLLRNVTPQLLLQVIDCVFVGVKGVRFNVKWIYRCNVLIVKWNVMIGFASTSRWVVLVYFKFLEVDVHGRTLQKCRYVKIRIQFWLGICLRFKWIQNWFKWQRIYVIRNWFNLMWFFRFIFHFWLNLFWLGFLSFSVNTKIKFLMFVLSAKLWFLRALMSLLMRLDIFLRIINLW